MPLKVLVVDDIAASRDALCALVRELGHDVLAAASGYDALAQVERETPDVVLLDLLMPDVDGFEVSRRMRSLTNGRWLPVIVTSGLEGEEHFIHALESGADDYLSRPVSAGLLAAKLRHYDRVLALQSRLGALARRQLDILDNILDPVVTLDGRGLVVELNVAALSLADADGRALARGARCTDVFGEDLPAFLGRRECTVRRAGGGSFTTQIGLSEWREGDRPYYTIVLRDVSEQRQIERMKDEFLATVSHELRTPLTSVLGAIGLLAGGAAGALPPKALPLAEMARRNGERLGRLIDDILDLTKLEGDRLVLQMRPLALPPLLDEALAANQGYAHRARVRLLLQPWSDTPLPAVRLDADRFLQVMANLLSNAIKHSPVEGTVRVSVQPRGDGVSVTVRDQGPGIDPRFRARLFEKFSQADGSDRRAVGGTGLGLYITRMLVERMGGRIRVDEVAGEGASFTVEFPSAAGTPATPMLLHIDADLQTRERVTRWLAPLGRVEGLAKLPPAGSAPATAAIVIGNPQGQGDAEAFCAGLRRIAAGRPVLLYGDSVDEVFCDRVGLPWLSPARSGSEELLGWARRALSGATGPGPAIGPARRDADLSGSPGGQR